MFGSVILDVAIGIVFIYLLLSLIATAIREGVAARLKTRSTTLHDGVTELLGDAQLVADLYNHPLINSLYRGDDYATARTNKQLPSYIPAKSFSTALTDLIVRGRDLDSVIDAGAEALPVTVENVRKQVTRVRNVRVQRVILAAIDTAKGDLDALHTNLEHWFDSTMDRVSGWYKHHTQIWLFWIGLTLAVFADADSIAIARRLYVDPVQRQAAVEMATRIGASDTVGVAAVQAAGARLDSLEVPLTGWSEEHLAWRSDFSGTVAKVAERSKHGFFGWLITALAISLGAPFWFDTLGRIMVIRNTVKPNQKSPNEGSTDRQSGGNGGNPPPSSTTPQRAAPAPVATIVLPPPAATAADFVPQEWEAGHPQGGVI